MLIQGYSDEALMRNNQEVRLNVTRAFNILRGLFKGALSHRNFGRMFDWFYP